MVVTTTPQAEQDGLTSEYIKDRGRGAVACTAGIKVIDKASGQRDDGILSIAISALPIEKLPHVRLLIYGRSKTDCNPTPRSGIPG